jgi:CubicO group peptidase (beta-lactamase class C family)
MRRIFYLIISLIFFGNISAQSIDKSKIDQFIKEAREKLNLKTGLAISVVIDDQVVLYEGYGLINVEKEIKATPDSPFYIASATKPLFATLVQMLSEKDSLYIDKPIADYLPDLQFSDENLNSKTISIRDMLTHRSGISNMPVSIRTAYTGQHDLKTLIELFKESRFTTSEFDYTNNGYLVTSLILQHMFNKPWQQLMVEKLLKPLQMNNTSPYVSQFDEDLLKGYKTKKGNVESVGFLKADNTMHAAGGIITTANDLGNFLKFYLNEGELNGNRILSKMKIEEAISSQINHSQKFYSYYRYAYGLGWQIGVYRDELLIHHFGSYSGSRSHISFMPEHNIGIAVLTNDDGDAFYSADLIADYIYNIYLGKEADEFAEKEIAPLITKMNSHETKSQKPGEEKTVKSSWDYNKLVGNYSNPVWGEIEINNDGELLFNWGNIKSDLALANEKLFIAHAGPFDAQVEFVEEGGEVTKLNLIGPGKLPFVKK